MGKMLNAIVNLQRKIKQQILDITPETTEAEKRNIETWNPILEAWHQELEEIKNILYKLVDDLEEAL